METNKQFWSFSGKIYLGWLRIILSIMPLLSMIIALHTCHILLSVTRSLLPHDNTNFEAEVLRMVWASLKLLALKGPIALVCTPFGN